MLKNYYTIWFFLGVTMLSFGQTVVKHPFKTFHKGISDIDPVSEVLYEVEDRTKHPNYFYTNVESVVCGDSVCSIVPVKLFWNDLGELTHYELSKGIVLEKEDGEEFTKADYFKLLTILRDTNSPLKRYYHEELVSKSNHNAADALSGATIEIDINAVVEGAIWTCYTLWHWANGGLVPLIRQITSEKTSYTLLLNYLKYSDISHRIFAIEQLTKREHYDKVTMDAVLRAAVISPKLNTQAMSYFENGASKNYFNYMLDLFHQSTLANRNRILNALKQTKHTANAQFYDTLSETLSKTDSYQEINNILNIFEAKTKASKAMIKNAMPLLNHKEFLIARRVYWYLNKVQLELPDKEKLQRFKTKYSKQL